MRFWLFLTAWPRGFVAWLHQAICALMTAEGRRAWAVMIAWGCGVIMTGYAIAVLWMVRGHAMLVFSLGLAAMFIVLVVISAFTGLLVKRDIGGSWSRDGGSFSIRDQGGERDHVDDPRPEPPHGGPGCDHA